jgi:hypothetical protein
MLDDIAVAGNNPLEVPPQHVLKRAPKSRAI